MKVMRKQIVFYPVCAFLYFVGVVLLRKIIVQKISSTLEGFMVFIPSMINIFIIIFSLYFSNRKDRLTILQTLVYFIFYGVVLITFVISVILALLLHLNITPKIEGLF